MNTSLEPVCNRLLDVEREAGMAMDWTRYGFAAPFAGNRPADVTV